MGNALHRDAEDNTTGFTEKERRLLHESWQNFTNRHPDYGVILFTALFVKHPEYQKLFKKFRDKELGTFMRDPVFTNHASTAGRQITAMVDALDSPGILLEIITKNMEFHPIGSGVKPKHYVEMGRVLVDVLSADEDEHATRATIKAWEKFLHLINQKTIEVYAEEVRLNKLKHIDPYEVECGMSTTDIMAGSNMSVEQVGHKQLPSAGLHHRKASLSEFSSKKEHPIESTSHHKVEVGHGSALGSIDQATTSGVPLKDKPEEHPHSHASEREHPKDAASHDKGGFVHGTTSDDTEQATTSEMPPKDKTETLSHSRVTERSALKTRSKDHLGHKRHVSPSTGSS